MFLVPQVLTYLDFIIVKKYDEGYDDQGFAIKLHVLKGLLPNLSKKYFFKKYVKRA